MRSKGEPRSGDPGPASGSSASIAGAEAVDRAHLGTRKLERLSENTGAEGVELTSVDLREIESARSKVTVQGARLPEEILKLSGR
jgi:hypothetical protein